MSKETLLDEVDSAKVLTETYKGCVVDYFECNDKNITIHFEDESCLIIGD